jgi:hypothetical protein
MFKKIKKALFGLLIAITLMAIITINMHQLFATPSPTLLVKPPSIIDPTVAPGSTITINASVVDITDLTTWQVTILYNSSILNCTSAWYPTDYVFAGKSTIPVIPVIDNLHGYVQHGCTLMIGQTGFTGSGTLCQIEFQVLDHGNTTLHFSEPYGSDTFLWDSNDELIPISIQDGYFDNRVAVSTYTLTITTTTGGTTNPAPGSHSYTQGTLVSVTAILDAGYKLDHWELDGANVGAPNPIEVTMNTDHTLHAVFIAAPPVGATLYVNPPEIIDPTMHPSSTFTINITVNDIANMRICEFNLTYNTAILSWMAIEVFKVQNQTPSSKVICDDEAGYVWVKLTYPSSITTDSPLALVRITFHVDAMGATPLNLNNTKLTDPMGQPIPHTAIGGFFATLIQDLAITNVVPSRNWVYQGELVDINVTAKNLGNQKESFDVKAYYDIGLIGTQHVTDLAPDAEVTLTFTWNTSLVDCKNYTIKAEATILPYETKTADNTYIDGTVKIFATDLTVTNVVASRNWVYQGQTVNINVTVKNLGLRYESFDVKAYYDTELIGTKHVTDMPPKTEVTLVITWNTSLVTPCHNYTITGEVTILPFEANTDNNKYVDGTIKVRFVGDLNGDGKVDMMDLRVIAKAFASYPGHPRWNPDADIDQNGHVDMRDIRLAAKNFGKGCT